MKVGDSVAVVGAGPAGLTAAQDLVKLGYSVTVFEALPVAGGMLRVGVPEYRLPAELIQREVDDILDLGIELRLNTRVEDLQELIAEGYDAIFLAVGAHEGKKLDIPGADLEGTMISIGFLRDARLGQEVELGRHPAAGGGGQIAEDEDRGDDVPLVDEAEGVAVAVVERGAQADHDLVVAVDVFQLAAGAVGGQE